MVQNMLNLEHTFAETLRGRGGEKTFQEESESAEQRVSETQKPCALGGQDMGREVWREVGTKIPSRTKEAEGAQQPAQVLLGTRGT